MDRTRIAIVGCGWFGNFHLDYLLTRQDVSVAALVSTNLEKLATTGAKVPDARQFSTYQALLDDGLDIDAIIVCVPPHQHGDLEIRAAERGIHLFVEKPIGLSLDYVHRAASAISASGVLASVGYHERYDPAVQALKEALAQEKIGFVQGRWLGDIPGALWWRQKACSGGQVVEQSTHLVDLMRYLFGEVSSVYAQKISGLVRDLPRYDVDDGTSTLITFECGIVANLLTGCYFNSDAPSTGIHIEILCPDQRICYRWMQDVTYERKSGTFLQQAGSESHHLAIDAFIDALRTGSRGQIQSPYSDSIKTLAVTLAINESLETNAPVML